MKPSSNILKTGLLAFAALGLTSAMGVSAQAKSFDRTNPMSGYAPYQPDPADDGSVVLPVGTRLPQPAPDAALIAGPVWEPNGGGGAFHPQGPRPSDPDPVPTEPDYPRPHPEPDWPRPFPKPDFPRPIPEPTDPGPNGPDKPIRL